MKRDAKVEGLEDNPVKYALSKAYCGSPEALALLPIVTPQGKRLSMLIVC